MKNDHAVRCRCRELRMMSRGQLLGEEVEVGAVARHHRALAGVVDEHRHRTGEVGIGLHEVGIDLLALRGLPRANCPNRSRPILPMNRVAIPARRAHTATLAALPPGVSITSPNVSPPRSSSLLVRMSTSQAKSPMTHIGAVDGAVGCSGTAARYRMARSSASPRGDRR
jgi:hypothetical protein